jgi:hypothetical protein
MLTVASFPSTVERLELQHNRIATLKGAKFPSSVRDLFLAANQITSLKGISFPATVQRLDLSRNRIATLAGASFPNGMTSLYLDRNRIATLAGAGLPEGLTWLHLDRNRITTLAQASLPEDLLYLSLRGNPISTLTGATLPPGLRKVYLDASLREPARAHPTAVGTVACFPSPDELRDDCENFGPRVLLTFAPWRPAIGEKVTVDVRVTAARGQTLGGKLTVTVRYGKSKPSRTVKLTAENSGKFVTVTMPGAPKPGFYSIRADYFLPHSPAPKVSRWEFFTVLDPENPQEWWD